MSYIGESIVRWLAPLPNSMGTWRIILAWEARRIFFNLAIISLYAACFMTYSWFIDAYPPDTEAGDDSSALFPFYLSLAALLLIVNIAYTLGWVGQIFYKRIDQARYFNRFCMIGLFSLTVLSLPVICWADYDYTLRTNLRNSA